ncbi:MAG: hypothetical protein IT254_07070 [Chitinophagaceae bacterium]|nr:hypothetical protein [Chitinophagaceae bacterium]
MEKNDFNVHAITYKLGNTVNERINAARKLQDAMVTAMVLMIENDRAERESPEMDVFLELLFEARIAEFYLKKLK